MRNSLTKNKKKKYIKIKLVISIVMFLVWFFLSHFIFGSIKQFAIKCPTFVALPQSSSVTKNQQKKKSYTSHTLNAVFQFIQFCAFKKIYKKKLKAAEIIFFAFFDLIFLPFLVFELFSWRYVNFYYPLNNTERKFRS